MNDFFSPKFCLYNKEHDIVAIWQNNFWYFFLWTTHQFLTVFKGGNRNKMF